VLACGSTYPHRGNINNMQLSPDEGEQEDAVEDEEVVREEDLSDEEADSAGPAKWVVPGCVGGAGERQGRVEGRVEEFESERV
jgi:hypothetical protein